jgi:hypothetical protein
LHSQDHNSRTVVPLLHSNLINVNILSILTASVPILIELDIIIHALVAIRICLVDLRTLRQFPIRLQTSCLVGAVLQYDVSLFVLIVAQGEEDNIALIYPDFLAEFTL